MPGSAKRFLLRLASRARLDRPVSLVPRRSLLVLMYHYFCEAGGESSRLVIAADRFREQMALVRRQFHPVVLSEALRLVSEGRRLPPRSVAITVDDAGVDFLQHAWPVLRDLSVPTCLAVCPGFADPEARHARVFGMAHAVVRHDSAAARTIREAIGLPALDYEGCFERLANLETERIEFGLREAGFGTEPEGPLPGSVRLPVLSFEQLRALVNTKLVEIASHSMTHPAFGRIPSPWARWEIMTSREACVRAFGRCACFMYPGGALTTPPEVGRQLVTEAGYEWAFVVAPAFVSSDSDSGSLGRVAIDGREDLAVSRLRISGLPALLSRGHGRKPWGWL